MVVCGFVSVSDDSTRRRCGWSAAGMYAYSDSSWCVVVVEASKAIVCGVEGGRRDGRDELYVKFT